MWPWQWSTYGASLLAGTDASGTKQGLLAWVHDPRPSFAPRSLNTLFSKLQINQSIIFCNSVNRVELLVSV